MTEQIVVLGRLPAKAVLRLLQEIERLSHGKHLLQLRIKMVVLDEIGVTLARVQQRIPLRLAKAVPAEIEAIVDLVNLRIPPQPDKAELREIEAPKGPEQRVTQAMVKIKALVEVGQANRFETPRLTRVDPKINLLAAAR